MRILTILLILGTVRSLLAAVRQHLWFTAMARQMQKNSENQEAWALPTALIAPVKGIDPGFREAARNLLLQELSAPYDLICVAETDADPALEWIRSLEKSFGEKVKARSVVYVISGLCQDRGQKVHNQTMALERLSEDIRIFAFIDSDGEPAPDFLSSLIKPLESEGIGASTGFRWYVPERDNFASAWVSLWNAMALAMIGQDQAFVWGGAMAIRRETFERGEVLRHWSGSVSDDLGVTRAVKSLGLKIAFVPACVVAQSAHFTFTSAIEFILRQTTITRVYGAKVHFAALAVNIFQIACFVSGIALMGEPEGWWLIGFYFALLVYGFERHYQARRLWPRTRSRLGWQGIILLVYPSLWILNCLTLLYCVNAKMITWRGIRYALRPKLKIFH